MTNKELNKIIEVYEAHESTKATYTIQAWRNFLTYLKCVRLDMIKPLVEEILFLRAQEPKTEEELKDFIAANRLRRTL